MSRFLRLFLCRFCYGFLTLFGNSCFLFFIFSIFLLFFSFVVFFLIVFLFEFGIIIIIIY